jgi:phospholipid/cholesterol/gamma-HCH transport system ATP-binding protein
MDFPRGKLIAVMGGSGSGKTTVLRLIGGQIRPQRGSVAVNGEIVHQLDTEGLYRLRRKMGMLFQFGALFTDLTVFENVAFPLREHADLPEELLRDLVLMRLNAVGLRNAAQLKPSEISGGMARRVALARAIALDPELIMYDEPFAGLDPISMGVTANLIRNLNDTLGSTSILVSHDVNETFSIADYVYFLSGGKIVASGTPEEMRRSSDPYVKQFVNAEPDGPVPFHYPGKSLAEDFGLGGQR